MQTKSHRKVFHLRSNPNILKTENRETHTKQYYHQQQFKQQNTPQSQLVNTLVLGLRLHQLFTIFH